MSTRAEWMTIAAWCALGTACASNTAPRNYLPDPRHAPKDAHGGWIELRYTDGAGEHSIDGELIAVGSDSAWILTRSSVQVVATASVTRGKLTAYASDRGQLAMATAGGVVSTIANGWFLIFTAPMWIIGGSVAAGAESRAPEHPIGRVRWADLVAYARFPAGLPSGIRLDELRGKRTN